MTAAGEPINGGALNWGMGCSNYFSAHYLAANNFQASAASLNTLMYTLGTFLAANASVMHGQIRASSSVAGSNGFALTYSASPGRGPSPALRR